MTQRENKKQIESMLSLAISVHKSPGVYALLLGSGISRSASIPTGWEIVLDLIQKVAILEGEDCSLQPDVWYKEKYEEEPDYSKLLEAVAKSPAERSQLLKDYFEPTEDEQEEGGIKVPTEAHKAIASLVKNKYIKVIITTNFDRLLEKALEEVGVTPQVISNPDTIKGSLPLVHSACTIVKVHGDYVDTRIKNTVAELEQYHPDLDRLLDRVFDDYGLIVCGWSGEWDKALREAIKRCPNGRFTTYWTGRGEPKGKAKELLGWRKGEFVKIKDADSFFRELEAKVVALEEIDLPHPLSAKIAVAQVKKYLVNSNSRIRLHDLVMDETERVYKELVSDRFPLDSNFSEEEFIKRVESYEALTEVLAAMMATGCYWSEEHHDSIWQKVIQRLTKLSNEDTRSSQNETWIRLQYYPALILFYTGGISALATSNYRTFAALVDKARVRSLITDRYFFTKDENRRQFTLNTYQIIEQDKYAQLLRNSKIDGENRHQRFISPLSDRLSEILPLRELLPEDEEYQFYFDKFEYLFVLLYYNLSGYLFPGRFLWKIDSRNKISNLLTQEAEKERKNWALFKTGLFQGDLNSFNSLKQELDSKLKNRRPWGQ